MRDILVTAIVFGALPFIFKRPWIGILLWCWLAYMNPHRQAWGFAYEFPFAIYLCDRHNPRFPDLEREKRNDLEMRATATAMNSIGWMLFTTPPWVQWNKVWKIQLMVFDGRDHQTPSAPLDDLKYYRPCR